MRNTTFVRGVGTNYDQWVIVRLMPPLVMCWGAKLLGGTIMAWTAPKLKEVNCGMEINMYSPAEGEGREYEQDLF
ncbi:hypothetical protein GCM10011517_22950 [Actibacterium pelagium]|uniref:Coenzyme PQQ synthesis protein A n=1 Tax=Actibacterium pelagium TaxID=2029103 RepID=A0A917AHZ4_9RHOB|nr:hypothetical protein GCM10011517_22950 [Actibacterium pelagium]